MSTAQRPTSDEKKLTKAEPKHGPVLGETPAEKAKRIHAQRMGNLVPWTSETAPRNGGRPVSISCNMTPQA